MLITALTCFILIPSIAFAVVADIQMKNIALTNFSNSLKNTAETQARNVEGYFRSLVSTSKQISESPYVTEFTKNGNDIEIKKFIETYKDIVVPDGTDSKHSSDLAAIIVADKSGELAFTTIEGLDASKAKETLKALGENTDGVVYCYSAEIYDAETEYSLFDSTEVKLAVKYASGDYSVIVIFNSKRISELSRLANTGVEAQTIYIDSKNVVIANYSYSSESQYQKFIGNASTGTTTQINNYNDKESIAFSIKPAAAEGETDHGWTIAVAADSEKAYKNSAGATGGIIGAIVFVSIIMIVAAIILIVLITKPLKVIEETLVKVRRGDHESRINIIANNEYGEISRAFNDLIDDIVVSEGRYRTIIEMSDNIIFEWNFKTNEVFFSNNFNKKFSYRAPSDHFGDSFLLKVKVHPDDSDRYHKDLEKLSKGEVFEGNEYRWKNIYGDFIWILLRTSTIRDRDGNIAKVVGVIIDIDRAKKSEKLLTERASFDSLTGLYNRETIERTIDNEIDLISVRKSEFAILFIDIDDFKIFNDKYSHATGDQVLKFVATTITDITQGYGTTGRYGGDEFVCCIRNVETNDPTAVAQEILNKLKEGFISDNGDKLSVNSSIGISIIQDSSMRVDEIIGMADDAMYKIKKSGKSNFGILNKETIKSTVVPETVEEEDIIDGGSSSATSVNEDDIIKDEDTTI